MWREREHKHRPAIIGWAIYFASFLLFGLLAWLSGIIIIFQAYAFFMIILTGALFIVGLFSPLIAPSFVYNPNIEKVDPRTRLARLRIELISLTEGWASLIVRGGREELHNGNIIFTGGRPLEFILLALGHVMAYQIVNTNGSELRRNTEGALVLENGETLKDIVGYDATSTSVVDFDDLENRGAPIKLHNDHPIQGSWLSPLFWTRRWLYVFNYILGGVRPWQGLFTYPIRRRKVTMVTREGGGTFSQLTETKDLSYHVRIFQFDWYIVVHNAEVAGMIPVTFTLHLQARIFDPYKALLGVENWSDLLDAIVHDVVVNTARETPLQVVFAAQAEEISPERQAEIRAQTEATQHIISERVIPANEDLKPAGIHIDKVNMKGLDPTISPEELEKLREPVFALQDKIAQIFREEGRGQGRARALQAIREEAEKNEPLAALITKLESDIKVSEGRATTMFMNSGGATSFSDNLLSAILDRLAPKDSQDETNTSEGDQDRTTTSETNNEEEHE